MQKTQRRSRTSCRTFWWLDNSRSQSSQWRLRILKQSSICNRGAGLRHSMDPGISVQHKNFTRNPEKLAKVLGARWETWSHWHWQFLGIRQSMWRSFLESLYVDTTRIRNKLDCWESSARSERRYFCSIVAIRSGWKLVGRFYGMLRLSAKRHRSIVWWEDALWKTFRATIQRTDYSIWSIGWVSPYNCEGRVKNPSMWKESLTWIVPWIRFVRGGIWKGDYWLQTLRCWRRWTHLKSTLKDSTLKEVKFTKEKWKIHFPAADGRIKLSGGDQELRTSTLMQEHPIRGESNVDFLGESEGSLPPLQDSFPHAGEAINDFWSMSGNFIYRHHVEPRVKLYSPREDPYSTEIHWRIQNYSNKIWMSCKNAASITIGISMGLETCLGSWTGFTQFTLLTEKLPEWYVVQGETNEKAINIQARNLENGGKKRQARREAKVVQWKTVTR